MGACSMQHHPGFVLVVSLNEHLGNTDRGLEQAAIFGLSGRGFDPGTSRQKQEALINRPGLPCCLDPPPESRTGDQRVCLGKAGAEDYFFFTKP